MKRFALIVFILISGFSFSAHAKLSQQVWEAIETTYRPAVWNKGLASAYVNPDPSKFRNYVVILKGGIAAEKARRLISWSEYDYREVTIDVKKDKLKNRRGAIYTYLQRGDVMAVAKLDKLGNVVYVSLISPEVYRPANRAKDKRFSRVTTLLKFKFPKSMAGSSDPTQVLAVMADWIKPFTGKYDAFECGQLIGNPSAQEKPTVSLKPEKAPSEKKGTPKPPTSPGMPPQIPDTDPNNTWY